MNFLTRVGPRGSAYAYICTTVQLQIGPVHYAKNDQNLIK